MQCLRVAILLGLLSPCCVAQQPKPPRQPDLEKLVKTYADAADALQAAVDAGPVLLPPGTLKISKPVVLKSGAVLRGNRSTIKAIGTVQGGVLQIAEGAESIFLEGVHLDASLCHTGLRIGNGRSSRVIVERCRFTGSLPHTNFLVDVDDGSSDITITRSSFQSARSCIRVRAATRNTRILESTFRQWLDYGILVRGTPAAGPTNTTIADCSFVEPVAGTGGARQMIVAYSEDRNAISNITGLIIRANFLEGPAEFYDRTSESSKGTADQLAITSCRDFVIANNISLNGGENGIAISLNCSRGIVTGNVSRGHDGHGIQVGSKNDAPAPDCRAISVTGNNCSDNGKRRDPKAPDTMANIYIQDAADINLSGNSCTSYSTPHDVAYGINVAESSRVQISDNNHIHFADSEGTRAVAIFSSTIAKRWEAYAPQPKPASEEGPAAKN